MKTKLINTLIIFWIVFLAFVGVSWGIGYYSNALNHSRWFDLSSCMVGISTAGGALGSLIMLVVRSIFHEREQTKRYDIDSKHNSLSGQLPRERRGAE